MTNHELAKAIIELLGGKSNITKVENCMTRLRIEISDDSLAKMSEIKQLTGVLGITETGLYKQIIVGPGKSKKLCDETKEILGIDGLTAGNWKIGRAHV